MTPQAPSSPSGRSFRPSWGQATWLLIALVTLVRIIALAVSQVELYPDESQYWVWSRSFDWGYFSKPPMIAWAIGASTSILGLSDFAIRLPASLFHAATASFLALGARQLVGHRAGFWTAAVYLTTPAIFLSSGIISTDAVLMSFWAAGLALAILSPNLMWNAAHEFATLQHTAANANWGGDLFHFAEMAEFAIAQFGVFGPALFATLIVAAFASLRGIFTFDGDPIRFLALFILPALIVVTLQAFISRAHANWAASAYVAGTLVVSLVLLSGPAWRRYVLYGSIAFASIIGVVFMAAAYQPALADGLGVGNAFKRVRGWQETADAIIAIEQNAAAEAVMFDDRNVFHQMQRYGTGIETPIYMWQRYGGPHNHADQTWPLPDGYDESVLVVSERPLDVARMRDDFTTFEPVGSITIDLGGNRTREFSLWRAQGYHRVERNQAYEDYWAGVDAAARAANE